MEKYQKHEVRRHPHNCCEVCEEQTHQTHHKPVMETDTVSDEMITEPLSDATAAG